MKQQKKILGFTLIELMVSISIIALITAVGLVSYTNANRNARDAKRKADLEQVRAAIEFYRTEVGSYPVPSGDSPADEFQDLISDLFSGEFLSNQVVTDPRNQDAYVYESDFTLSSDADCGNRAYKLCATLEKDGGTDYCICAP